ncbi:MAG TPA: hypothetical protein VGM41_20365 [Chitinophagaceae bacterium]|jgi:hypothetical protein
MQQVVYLRKLRDFGEKISDSFLFLKQNWKKLFGLYAVFVVPFFIVAIVMGIFFAGHVYANLLSSAESFRPADLLTGEFYIIILCLLLASSSYNTAVYSYFRVYDGQNGIKPTLQQVGQVFIAKFFKVFLYNFVITILLVLVAIIPFIIVMFIPIVNIFAILFFILLFIVIIFYLNCIYVTEDMGLSGGISRLFYILSSRWWNTIWFMVVIFLIYSVFSFAVQLGMSLIKNIFFDSVFSPVRNRVAGAGPGAINIGVLLYGLLFIVQQMFYMIVFCSVGINYYSLAEEKDGSAIEAQIDSIGGTTDKYDGVEEQY